MYIYSAVIAASFIGALGSVAQFFKYVAVFGLAAPISYRFAILIALILKTDLKKKVTDLCIKHWGALRNHRK